MLLLRYRDVTLQDTHLVRNYLPTYLRSSLAFAQFQLIEYLDAHFLSTRLGRNIQSLPRFPRRSTDRVL